MYLHAIALWTWSNFLHGSSSPSVCNAHANFDETDVCLFQDSKAATWSLPPPPTAAATATLAPDLHGVLGLLRHEHAAACTV